MWLFLSRRLRTWLLLTVGLPAVRFAVHKIAVAAADRRSDATTTKWLSRADRAVTSVSRRAARGRA